MLLLILFRRALPWDEDSFLKHVLTLAQRIIELPGDFTLNTTSSEPPDDTGAVFHSVTGKINETTVYIQFYEVNDGRLELNWVEGINHEQRGE
jgi:hypothetical protein